MIEAPECILGYPLDQLDEVLGSDERRQAFRRWFTGQTGAVCDGMRFDYDKGQYEDTECVDAPHGMVVYEYDVRRFLATVER